MPPRDAGDFVRNYLDDVELWLANLTLLLKAASPEAMVEDACVTGDALTARKHISALRKAIRESAGVLAARIINA